MANANKLGFPLISKHNRAGKGLGVYKFNNYHDLANFYKNPNFESSVDGINLIQSYIDAPEPFICLLYTSPSPRDRTRSRMPSSA